MLDLSHHNGVLSVDDFKKIKAAGHTAIYFKASEGLSETDQRYHANVANSIEAGIHPGPYHFFHVAEDPIKQAHHFVNVIQAGRYDGFCMPPACDLEDRSGMAHTSKAHMNTYVHRFQGAVSALLKRTCVLYLDKDFAKTYLDATHGLYDDLWIANYRVKSPFVPIGWKMVGKTWKVWQYDDQGAIPGVLDSGVDMDHFNGTEQDLLKWIADSVIHPSGGHGG